MELPILNLEAASQNAAGEDSDEQEMMDDSGEQQLIDTSVVIEILKIFASKQLTDKIELTLLDTSLDENSKKDLCQSVSYICNFIFLNSNTKIHKTLYALGFVNSI
jgi:hypothetical protein